VGTQYAVLALTDDASSEPSDRHELLVHFWGEPPARLREETETLSPRPSSHLVVRDGERWWTYSPEWGAVSNVAADGESRNVGTGGGELWMTLLDPSVWIPVLDFELEGEVEVLGRRALRVHALPRTPRGDDPFQFRTQLAVGADAYRLLIDRDLGVALRVAAVLEGEEFWGSEFEELVFDEELSTETFVFEPPPGVEIRGPDAHFPEVVSLEEAARRASFPLFFVPELPEGRWDLHVTYIAPRTQPPLTESAHLAYHRADATHHVMVTLRPASELESEPVPYSDDGLEVEEVERAGRSLTVYRPTSRRLGLPLTVVCERDGTSIQLGSDNLDEDVLLTIAASLERFEVQ
jgi:outer membrane lipoprotein-sorting protein